MKFMKLLTAAMLSSVLAFSAYAADDQNPAQMQAQPAAPQDQTANAANPAAQQQLAGSDQADKSEKTVYHKGMKCKCKAAHKKRHARNKSNDKVASADADANQTQAAANPAQAAAQPEMSSDNPAAQQAQAPSQNS